MARSWIVGPSGSTGRLCVVGAGPAVRVLPRIVAATAVNIDQKSPGASSTEGVNLDNFRTSSGTGNTPALIRSATVT